MAAKKQELKTEPPLSEKDEVAAAAMRTKKLYERAARSKRKADDEQKPSGQPNQADG